MGRKYNTFIIILLLLWLYSPLLGLGRFFNLLILYTVGRTTLTGDQPTIPAIELAKTVHALDRTATLIGKYIYVQRLPQIINVLL
jgi:hypothetical protein